MKGRLTEKYGRTGMTSSTGMSMIARYNRAPALLQELLQSFTMDKRFEEGGELGTAIIN